MRFEVARFVAGRAAPEALEDDLAAEPFAVERFAVERFAVERFAVEPLAVLLGVERLAVGDLELEDRAVADFRAPVRRRAWSPPERVPPSDPSWSSRSCAST